MWSRRLMSHCIRMYWGGLSWNNDMKRTPQLATVRLEGRRLSSHRGDQRLGSAAAMGEIKRNGQVVATVERTDRSGVMSIPTRRRANMKSCCKCGTTSAMPRTHKANSPPAGSSIYPTARDLHDLTYYRPLSRSSFSAGSMLSVVIGCALAGGFAKRRQANADPREDIPMLNIGNEKTSLCSGVTRRSFLQVGVAAGMAGQIWLPDLLKTRSVRPGRSAAAARIKNCITIFLVGSPGHLDTWDLKPNAPSEVRGKYMPIRTNVNGIQICEHFPMMARRMDKIALIRSLHHRTGATHENGQRWMMTGHDFNADSVKPHCGSVISRVFGQKSELPANVILPGPIGNTGAGNFHGQTAGHIGSAHEPFFLGADPAAANFRVGDLDVPTGMSASRLDARRQLLTQLDELAAPHRDAQHADVR